MLLEKPKKCPYCSHEVVLTSNKEIYGQEYGNGKCYLCHNCGASVGTHNGPRNRPLGILATKEMKVLKKACHDLFDIPWKTRKISRGRCYSIMAEKLGIETNDCHFGHFETPRLLKSLEILSNPSWYK